MKYSHWITGLVMGAALPMAASAGITDGVSDEPAAHAQTGALNFDPPCLFSGTLPLQIEQHTDTNAIFAQGNGSVLDECAGFTVSGHSSPNFLAWNCAANNVDGTVPELPQLILFRSPVSNVSMNIGSNSFAGAAGGIVALDAGFNNLGFDSVNLTPALQNVSFSAGAAAIKAIVVFGPCSMVGDDLTFN